MIPNTPLSSLIINLVAKGYNVQFSPDYNEDGDHSCRVTLRRFSYFQTCLIHQDRLRDEVTMASVLNGLKKDLDKDIKARRASIRE